MRLLRPSSLLLLLTLALFAWFASMAGRGSYYSGVIGDERFFAWGLPDGAVFVRSKLASPAARSPRRLHPHSGEVSQIWPRVTQLHWRTRWGLIRHTAQRPAGRTDVLYVSYPWLLGLTLLPAAVWIMLLTRRPRRRVAGACPNCAYDVRATPDRCPECGQALAPPSMLDRVLSFDVKWFREYVRRDQRGFPVAPGGPTRPPPTT